MQYALLICDGPEAYDGLGDAEREALLADVRETLDAPRYRRKWRTELHWTRLADVG
jgi:hypothetical protein